MLYTRNRFNLQVVGIVLRPSTLVNEVRIRSPIAQETQVVFDLIQRVDEVSPRKSPFRATLLTRSRSAGLDLREYVLYLGLDTSGLRCCTLRRSVLQTEVRDLNLGDAVIFSFRIFTILAEVGWFVHVNPQSVDINPSLRIEERRELVVPVALYIRVKPIWEGRYTGPDFSFENASIGLLQENVRIQSVVVGRIILCGDCRVYLQR
jgi:hypothetical protein